MNINDIEKIIEEECGHKVCAYCGTPFQPYHSRQKTCGSPECIHKAHLEYLRTRPLKMSAEELEAYRQRKREANREYMRRKRSKEKAEADIEKLEERAKKMQHQYEPFEDGMNYGKRQAEKILASVPKIDTSGFERKEKKDEQSTQKQS